MFFSWLHQSSSVLNKKEAAYVRISGLFYVDLKGFIG